jgi:hypothetical protein
LIKVREILYESALRVRGRPVRPLVYLRE